MADLRAETATSINLKRLATETALPVASPASNGGTASGTIPAVVGKVTPVRYDGKTRRGRKRNVRTFAHFLDSRKRKIEGGVPINAVMVKRPTWIKTEQHVGGVLSAAGITSRRKA